MDQELVGYILNALEPDEQERVRQELRRSPQAQQKLEVLRQAVEPLAYDAEPPEPPEDLLLSTLRRVGRYRCQQQAAEDSARRATPIRHRSFPITPRSLWKRADVLVAACIALVFLGMIPPSLLYLQHREKRLACAANLRQFYPAFVEFANRQGNGYLPVPDSSGPLAAAGVYGAWLREANCWNPHMHVYCPANLKPGQKPPPPPPTVTELRASYETPIYAEYRRRMGGCYAYHLGYCDGQGHLFGIHCRQGDLVPILADRPPRPGETADWRIANSLNHGGRGQNVLFLGGHVRFVTSRFLGSDDIFLNDNGRCAAGCCPEDIVLAPSETAPLPSERN